MTSAAQLRLFHRFTNSARDDGVGIAPESLANVFEMFTQEDRSLSRSQGGLGIGLSVVRSMVEQHGGQVSVHSDGEGRGSSFSVVLPRAVAPPAMTIDLPTATRRAFKPAHILIADDNVDAGSMLSMLLRLSGFKVDVVLDGPSAVSAFREFQPDVLVCDIGLPGISGYEVAAQVRGQPLGASAPLIALTGYDAESDRRAARAARAAALIIM